MKYVFALVALFFLANPAHAFEFDLVGAANFSTPSIKTSGGAATGVSSKVASGGGVLLGFDFAPFTQLQLGALYVGRHYTYPAGAAQGENSYFSYEVPVLLRLVPVKYFSIGGGVYYAVPTGQDSQTASDATNLFKNDLGLVGSAAIQFPLGIATSFLVDGRYYYGLTNASKIDGETLKYRDVQLLAGISFGF